MNKLSVGLGLLMALTLMVTAGCATHKLTDPDNINYGLIYGHIEGGRTRVITLYFAKDKQRVVLPFTGLNATVDEMGFYVVENVEPGKYYIVGLSDGMRTLLVAAESRESGVVTVAPKQAAYVGSFMAEIPRSPVYDDNVRFVLKPLNQPSQAQLRERLKKRIQGTGWESYLPPETSNP